MAFIKKNMEAVEFFLILSFIIIMLLVINSYDETNAGFTEGYSVETLTNGWILEDPQGEEKRISLPINTNPQDDTSVAIKRVLSGNIGTDDAICFRTSHSRVVVLIENMVIYDYVWDSEITLGDSPGSVWNIVDLKPEYAGKTLTIRTYSPYSSYNGLFRSVMYGSKTNIMLFLQKETGMMFFLSCIPFVLGILLMFLAFFAWKVMSSKPFVYVGIFMIVVGVWEMTESGYLQFILKNTYTLQILNLLFFGFIPLSALMALKYTNLLKYHFKQLFYVNAAIFAMYVLAQFIGISDMNSSLWMIHMAIVVAGIYVFVDTKKYYEEIGEKGKFAFIAATYLLILFANVLDIYRLYVFPDSYNGAITRYAIVIFILLISINVVYASLAVQRTNIEKETIINMAYTDNLTGINNRRSFEEDTEKLVDDKKNFTVVAVDMNNLKMINDELGHKFGDEALIKVANGLKMFEKFGEKCYRMGGDEFEVICTHMTSDEIDKLCKEINDELGKTEYFPGKPLSMAYGYFRFCANMDKEINKVLAQADKKMYENKAKMKAMGYATRD